MSEVATQAPAGRRRVQVRATETTALAGASVAIVAFYLVTRLVLLPRFPPFTDEANYAGWLERGYTHPAERLLSVSNGREPLLVWLGMFPMRLGFDPLTSLRLVSLAAGLVTMLFTALIAARLGGRRVAVTAAAVYAVLPFVFVHDVIGIMDPLVAATVALALYLQLRLAEEQRLDLALLLGITLAAGILTKETAKLEILLIPVSLLLFQWRAPALGRRLASWLGAVVLAVVMARLAYQVLSLNPDYYRLAEIRAIIDQRHTVDEVLDDPWGIVSANVPGQLRAYEGYFTWPFVALLVTGAVIAFRERWRLATVLLVWAAAPFAMATLFGLLAFPRYLLSTLPSLIAFLALGLVRTVGLVLARVHGPPVRRIAAVTLFVFVVSGSALAFDARVELDPNRTRYPALDDVQYSKGWPSGNGWVAFIEEIRRRAPNGAEVAVGSFQTFSGIVTLRLPPSYSFVEDDSPGARAAPFVVESLYPHTDPGYGTLREVWRYQRPRGGPAVILYARGFQVGDRFAASPDELRALLGLTPEAFARWLERHARARAWRDAQPPG